MSGGPAQLGRRCCYIWQPVSTGRKRSISGDGPGWGQGYSAACRVLEIVFLKGIKAHELRVEDPTHMEIG